MNYDKDTSSDHPHRSHHKHVDPSPADPKPDAPAIGSDGAASLTSDAPAVDPLAVTEGDAHPASDGPDSVTGGAG